eukprot:scaffold26104_cov122-Isochrysis_galbana.AAC.2
MAAPHSVAPVFADALQVTPREHVSAPAPAHKFTRCALDPRRREERPDGSLARVCRVQCFPCEQLQRGQRVLPKRRLDARNLIAGLRAVAPRYRQDRDAGTASLLFPVGIACLLVILSDGIRGPQRELHLAPIVLPRPQHQQIVLAARPVRVHLLQARRQRRAPTFDPSSAPVE